MKFDELLKNRRSVRKYKEGSVSVELIQEIINESTLAPNVGYDQPWKFIIVRNKAMLKRISDEGIRKVYISYLIAEHY